MYHGALNQQKPLDMMYAYKVSLQNKLPSSMMKRKGRRGGLVIDSDGWQIDTTRSPDRFPY
jgi:hypothetical protein